MQDLEEPQVAGHEGLTGTARSPHKASDPSVEKSTISMQDVEELRRASHEELASAT